MSCYTFTFSSSRQHSPASRKVFYTVIVKSAISDRKIYKHTFAVEATHEYNIEELLRNIRLIKEKKVEDAFNHVLFDDLILDKYSAKIQSTYMCNYEELYCTFYVDSNYKEFLDGLETCLMETIGYFKKPNLSTS